MFDEHMETNTGPNRAYSADQAEFPPVQAAKMIHRNPKYTAGPVIPPAPREGTNDRTGFRHRDRLQAAVPDGTLVSTCPF
jgi:hypothetical protein